MDDSAITEDKTFLREDQRISSNDVLQALASGLPVRLIRCTISGSLDLNRLFRPEEGFDLTGLEVHEKAEAHLITFNSPLVFQSCTFESEVFFAPHWDARGQLKVIFKEDVMFNSSVFTGQTRFSEARFCKLAGFDGCTFQRVASFTETVFEARAMFRTAAFEGYGLFNDARFTGDIRFTNTSFHKGANYTRVRFENRTDFSGVYGQSKSVPVHKGVVFARKRYGDEESFWRFIKQASQEAGYYQDAGECFYRESCARFWQKFRGPDYDQLTGGKKLKRWLASVRLLPELFFGRWLFGYGERPTRVLISALLIVVLCAVFYSSDSGHVVYRENPNAHFSLIDGLYFSTVTFTTLGLGDVYPAGGSMLTRLIAGAEAIAGACLMALFVVTLAKRYSRG